MDDGWRNKWKFRALIFTKSGEIYFKCVLKLLDKLNYNEDWTKEQQILESMAIDQIEKANAEENDKWFQAEKIAIQNWQQLQERLKMLRQEKLEKEAKLKLVSTITIIY